MARIITVLASILAIGTIGAAQAQGLSAYDATTYLPREVGNVVGGGGATLSGGGDNMLISPSGGGAGGGMLFAQVPRLARAVNTTTGGASVEYLEPERAPSGREARLIGGGDNAEVVYLSPNQRR